jgi:transcriptional regulator with XRE-family HTH domain
MRMARHKKNLWYLKQWRKYRGYTQDRLAEMTGLSKPFISQLERGERGYTQDTLELFAEALQCDIADLLVRDPTDPDGIWSIWDQLRPVERSQVVEIAKTLKRTGTDG